MNYKYTFTVFTPTYNRGENLINIYEDLKKQIFDDFEWLIVDDGSTDNTSDIVKNFIKDNLISIKYIKKQNGGKHIAINVGVKNAKGEIFFIADSDDRIINDTLQIIYDAWSEVNNKDEFCGVAGLFSYENGEIVGSKFDDRYTEVSFTDVYKKYNVTGDKTVAFKTDVMKEFPFPEEEGIKFIMEAVVWDEISKKYKVKCVNKVIQIKEYLDDGLTKSSYSKRILSGIAYSNLLLINQNTYPINKYTKDRIWNYIHLCSNSLLIGKNYFKQINKISDKLLYILFYPRGLVAYLRMKKYVQE